LSPITSVSPVPHTISPVDSKSAMANGLSTQKIQPHVDEEHISQWIGGSTSREALFSSERQTEKQTLDMLLEKEREEEREKDLQIQSQIKKLVTQHLKDHPLDADFGEHGAVVIDLDEAVHGMYSGVNYGKQGVEKGVSEIAKTLAEEAKLLHHKPLEYIRHELQPENYADIALTGAITVFLTPLAFKALMAGIEEFHEAGEHAKELKVVRKDKKRQLNQLEQAFKEIPSDQRQEPLQKLVNGAKFYATQQDDDLALAEKQNRLSQAIGVASAVSGGAILAGTTTKLGTQIGLTAASGGTANIQNFLTGSAAATAGTTALGAASTFALAPVAALGAIGLGAAFSIKSHKKFKNLKQRTIPTMDYFKEIRNEKNPEKTDALEKYQYFIHTKIDQRERFYKDFDRSNKLFLAASSVYGAGAIGKAVIVGAALAGVGLLSNPVTLGATVGVAAVGGIGMALNSHQFLTGHGKQHRYDEYLNTDIPLIDRHFLASADLLSTPDQGLSLRAGFYNLIKQREDRRQDFLVAVANDKNRAYSKKLHSTDTGFRSPKDQVKTNVLKGFERLRGKGPASLSSEATPPNSEVTPNLHSNRRSSFAQKLKANALAVGSSFNAIAQGDIKHALSHAKNTRMKHIDKLSTGVVQSWLTESQNLEKQLKYMEDDLSDLKAYLEMKLATHQTFRENASNLDVFHSARNSFSDLDDVHSARNSFSDPDDIFLPRTNPTTGLKEFVHSSTNLSEPLATSDNDPQHEAQINPLTDFLERLDKNQERDYLMLHQVKNLEREINELREADTTPETQDKLAFESRRKLALVRERYLNLQGGKLYDENKQPLPSASVSLNELTFAKQILREAPQDYKHLRGILLETEMQATMARKLYDGYHQQPTFYA